jgi:Arm DNA-binding domain
MQARCRDLEPLRHQNSGSRMLTETELQAIQPLRHSRKISDGGGLYLLVTPTGRCWRYAYRYGQKQKALALGTYPEVPLERARSRLEFARNLLAHGLDPSALKVAFGKHIFVVTMRGWEIARGHVSALPLYSQR